MFLRSFCHPCIFLQSFHPFLFFMLFSPMFFTKFSPMLFSPMFYHPYFLQRFHPYFLQSFHPCFFFLFSLILFHKVTPMLFSTHAFCHPKRFAKFSPMFFLQNLPRRFSPMFFTKFSPMFFYHPSFLTHTFFTQLLSTHTFHPYFSPILSTKFSPVPFSPIFFSTKCFLQNLNLILFHLSLVIGILSHILFFHPCFFIHTFKKVFTCTFSPIPFYKVFTYTLLQSFYPYFSPIFSIHTFYKVCTHTFFTRL